MCGPLYQSWLPQKQEALHRFPATSPNTQLHLLLGPSFGTELDLTKDNLNSLAQQKTLNLFPVRLVS